MTIVRKETGTLSLSKFVARDQVKAIELAQPSEAMIKVSKPKRERFLTLPRMRKANPPAHLIRSTNGDSIRGQLLKMDDKNLKLEIRLEPGRFHATGFP